MRKILIGCLLIITAASYSSTDVFSTLKQLEANFHQLEVKEGTVDNQREVEAIDKALISSREKYQKLLAIEKYITEVEPYRYYQEDYKELLKKCKEEKQKIKREIEEKEEIINMYRQIC